jgi:hypothetical protein
VVDQQAGEVVDVVGVDPRPVALDVDHNICVDRLTASAILSVPLLCFARSAHSAPNSAA